MKEQKLAKLVSFLSSISSGYFAIILMVAFNVAIFYIGLSNRYYFNAVVKRFQDISVIGADGNSTERPIYDMFIGKTSYEASSVDGLKIYPGWVHNFFNSPF